MVETLSTVEKRAKRMPDNTVETTPYFWNSVAWLNFPLPPSASLSPSLPKQRNFYCSILLLYHKWWKLGQAWKQNQQLMNWAFNVADSFRIIRSSAGSDQAGHWAELRFMSLLTHIFFFKITSHSNFKMKILVTSVVLIFLCFCYCNGTIIETKLGKIEGFKSW